MHSTHEHDRWELLWTKRIGGCCLYIQGLSLSMSIPGCCLSSSQDEQPPEGLEGHAVQVGSSAGGAQITCQAQRLWLCPRLVPQRSALLWPGDWSSRASLILLPDGCARALRDPRAELLPKYWQNQWLLQQEARVIKPSGFSEPSRTAAYVFIYTSCLFCRTTLPVIESYADTFYEIKIQAIHTSHRDPLQSRFFWKLIQIWDNYVIANNFTTLLVIIPLSHRQI